MGLDTGPPGAHPNLHNPYFEAASLQLAKGMLLIFVRLPGRIPRAYAFEDQRFLCRIEAKCIGRRG